MKKAFTLIELLVVVLIIGILAAIALPQYQKAVEISKAKAILPLARAIFNAQKVYYLANERYAETFDELDLSLPEGGSLNDTGTEYTFSNHQKIILDGGSPGVKVYPNTRLNYFFKWYYDTDKLQCWAYSKNTVRNDEICKSITGQNTIDNVSGNWNAYKMNH